MRQNNASKEYYNHKLANHYRDFTVKEPAKLLDFLIHGAPGATRTAAKQWLSRRMVYVDKVITTQFDTALRPGQLVQIATRGNIHAFRSAYAKIVYEDAFLLVVEKAEGILTNAVPGSRENSLKRVLDEYVKRRNRYQSVHTVHRLDRATSGLLLFAKNRDVQQQFTEAWHSYVTDRRYVAVVHGRMERQSGTVQSYIADNRMFVSYSSPTDENGGRLAITHYRTLRATDLYSLVELTLETGRKNQIRVHMHDLGHPVVGDSKYGSESDPASRVCLHACRLEFVHPVTGERLHFDSPAPAAFTRLFEPQEPENAAAPQ